MAESIYNLAEIDAMNESIAYERMNHENNKA